MPTVTKLLTRAIVFNHRERPASPDVVRALKESMAEIGLLNPITVQRHRAANTVYLVAGRNRLEAARQLKWEAIDCIELLDLDDVEDAKTVGGLAEIAENLHRRELDALERNELLTEWASLREARSAQSRQAGAIEGSRREDGRGHRRPGGIKQAARDLGVPEQTIRRATKVASLSPVAKAKARSTGLANNQTALLNAAKHKEPAAQVAALDQHAAKPRQSRNDETDNVECLKAAWEASSEHERERFIAWLHMQPGSGIDLAAT
jgi:ParB-like chromosome segregation protein Spo0J